MKESLNVTRTSLNYKFFGNSKDNVIPKSTAMFTAMLRSKHKNGRENIL
jgi:hypothetical protein